MNFFLDTNILFKDPFLLTNYNRQLVELVRTNLELERPDEDTLEEFGLDPQFLDEEFRIYIASVVYEEAKNHYFKKIKDRFKQLKEINKDITWYMDSQEEAKFPFTEEQCKQRFDQYYNGLIQDGIVTILPPPNEVTQELIARAIQKKEPFFNNGKNEFRDAVIWLTYATFAEENDLENCYFITDNVTDFSRKADREQTPIPLHPELRNDSNKFVMYRSVQDLFTSDNEFKARLEEYNEIKYHLEDMELFTKLRKLRDDVLDNEFVLSLLNNNENNLLSTIESAIENHIVNRMDVDSLIDDVNFGGYLQPNQTWIEVNTVDIHDKEIAENAVLVSATIKVPYTISVYLYNPVYDTRDEKYEFATDKEVEFTIPISFLINIEHEISNFECDTPWID
jgi:cell fate (sporulation/competence/biofilm development) regulator YlbF (YheA/YmcA/DUF963 family)